MGPAPLEKNCQMFCPDRSYAFLVNPLLSINFIGINIRPVEVLATADTLVHPIEA